MKKYLLLAILILASATFASAQSAGDIEATTKDGKAVVLKADGTWEFKPVAKVKALGVTMTGFEAIKEGMTYSEVAAILGHSGSKLSETGKIVMYSWNATKGTLGANMNAMFEDGKLTSKAQFGLK